MKNKVLTLVYLAFFCKYLSETPHLSLSAHALQVVLILAAIGQ